ncbi:hypothetical protein SAMN04488074_11935 [Lentzea albidocapillata subsp. violacea]|uniref:Uncharacterized protein n=1 Tax=Lentzea albidocapillata subsp. violacea TaxID=128104 RepID=A0A1G9RVP1_9PSEU|nr:hypothetical protein SAMN04488074_11935 [Lentzea albidocapillata subsp. violacea]
MTNGVLEKMLRDELHGDLAQLIRIVAEGDDESVLSVARQDVPRLVRVLRALTEQHKPDANGRCTECRRGWLRRLPGACRMLLVVRLAWTVDGPEEPVAVPKVRGCSAVRRGRSRW